MEINKLINGCTDKRLIEWQTKASQYEVVNTIMQMKIIDIIERDKIFVDYGISVEVEQNCLLVGIKNINDYQVDALLLTKDDIVLLRDIEEIEGGLADAGPIGTMSHNNFWNWLESFPNINKWLNPESQILKFSRDTIVDKWENNNDLN